MIYAIIDVEIRDGNYEYHLTRSCSGDSIEQAVVSGMYNDIEWVQNDYRKCLLNTYKEITKEEYDIFQKYNI